jgi:hypothetical protein
MFDQKILKLFEAYDQQTVDTGNPARLAGLLLREPGPLLRGLGAGDRVAERSVALLVVAAVMCAAYGAVLGLFGGGLQPLLAAAKLPIIVIGSALLCTPTLYVFNALGGSRLGYLQTVALALLFSAAASMMLIAFAPIAWFFGVSTEGASFMRGLHLVVFAVAAMFGFRLLNVARRYLEFRGGGTILGPGLFFLRSVLVLLVGSQMAWWFRPILLPGPFHTGQRGLFTDFLFGG